MQIADGGTTFEIPEVGKVFTALIRHSSGETGIRRGFYTAADATKWINQDKGDGPLFRGRLAEEIADPVADYSDNAAGGC